MGLDPGQRMKNGTAFLGFLLSGALGFAVGYSVGLQRGSAGTAGGQPGRQAQPDRPATASDRLRVPVGGSPTLGPEDAPVTLVFFGDFECPFSRRAASTTRELLRRYPRELRVVYKHFPMPEHAHAALAAEVALAAEATGRFWPLFDLLFAAEEPLSRDRILDLAGRAGLPPAEAERALNLGLSRERLAQDQALGARLRLSSTPVFFLNGVRLSGAQPLANFEKMIEEQLALARERLEAGTPAAELYTRLMGEAREAPPPPTPARPQALLRQDVPLAADAPARGAKEPLVTIVEFNNFECPHCAQVLPTLEQILKDYPDRVQVQFRHLPFDHFRRSEAAARAGVAAERQGKFWPLHARLMARPAALDDPDLVRAAEAAGLDVARFKADLALLATADRVKLDKDLAQKLQVRGTPTYFVNGRPVRGAQPYVVFRAAIERELELAEQLLRAGTPRKDVYAAVMKTQAGQPLEPEDSGVLTQPRP